MGALQKCRLPIVTLKRLQIKSNQKYNTNTHKDKQQANKNRDNNINIVVPYTKGLDESFKSIHNKLG